MYGMINRAVEDLIRRRAGDETWSRVREQAGVGAAPFMAMESYPDEVTYRLVGAASEVLGLPVPEVLGAFGEHWVLYTAQEGYGDLLAMGGTTMQEFITNLHNLHSHVAMGFPHLTPPSFWCTDATATSVRLHYQSTRPGLAPMVVGLLRGLGKVYQTDVRVTHDRCVAEGADHDEFVVEYLPSAP